MLCVIDDADGRDGDAGGDAGGGGGGGADDVRWCEKNSGPTTVTDRHGRRHAVHVSRLRDGSVWARVGRAAMDWTAVDERRHRIQTALLDDDDVAALRALTYSDRCALTDVRLRLRVRAGWSPSYVVLVDAGGGSGGGGGTRIISVRNARGECRFNTSLTLSADRQRLVCNGDGPAANKCGTTRASASPLNAPSRRGLPLLHQPQQPLCSSPRCEPTSAGCGTYRRVARRPPTPLARRQQMGRGS